MSNRWPCVARSRPSRDPDSDALLELTWERVTPGYRERGCEWALDEIPPVSAAPPRDSSFVTGQIALPRTVTVPGAAPAAPGVHPLAAPQGGRAARPAAPSAPNG
ncbi:hypothetical protein GCM10011583_06520 [Streptomyces camponoticapitis]|uniref:Uncharacterized protein n=1 Tax=Streptomyces camponoticapitis TaxID=1616125 RepID=A0ABQ2DY56_9ACTN|nr:hypothetical protein [Streptomyces camponoticapitis]GGJ77815.1 hypothetical protein GCM10011583_06520 [Streptomyces camponoticapitis]